MLCAKLNSRESQIDRIQEEDESDGKDDENVIDQMYGHNTNSNTSTGNFRRDSTKAPRKLSSIYSPPPVTPKTPKRYIKLRTSSIIGRSMSDCSFTSIESESSQSDSAFCNNANMPNKITGEFGVEIIPSFLHDVNHQELMFRYVHDRHFQYIHPSVFAPACLTSVRRMGGGGSGVPVFSGTHPELGDIVMKHGGCSDMKELFALATISAELAKRGQQGKTETDVDSSTASISSKEAARDMICCLPEFKMVYISPQQVLFKQKAVWGKLKKLIRIGSARTRRDSVRSLALKIELSENLLQSGSNHSKQSSTMVTLNDSKFLGPGASIRIYQCEYAKRAKAFLEEDRSLVSPRRKKAPSLAFVVPTDRIRSATDTTLSVGCSEDFNSLQHVYEDLSGLMSKHLFKFTLAQKRIGGKNAKTGSQWLYEGKLVDGLLDNLITKFVRTVRDLQALTLPEEVDVVEQLREEVQKLKDIEDGLVQTDDLSSAADQFLGNAIKKNFHPIKGRIPFLSKTCNSFKSEDIFLMPEEELPAKHLAALVEPDALMSDIFLDTSSAPPLIQPNRELWMTMLEQATSDRPSMPPNATQRMWTAGLCDAGIHNLFVSEDDLYFFDLGVPTLQSLPGFMTKFLFSFFHVLGMQEDDTSFEIEWIRRFQPEKDKLALTPETIDLLDHAYECFEVAMDRIIDEIFDGDQCLRWLLLQYVTLQLLSDASFCLQRWQLKGGGSHRDENHFDKGLEQWLWRALWDIYVAFDINTVESWNFLKVEHPDCREDLNDTIGENLRKSMENSIDGYSFDTSFEELRRRDYSSKEFEEGLEEEKSEHLEEEESEREQPQIPRRSASLFSERRISSGISHDTPRRMSSLTCYSRRSQRHSLDTFSSGMSQFDDTPLRQLTASSFTLSRSESTIPDDGPVVSDDVDQYFHPDDDSDSEENSEES